MKKQKPKQKSNTHTTDSVKGLIEILNLYPEDAKVYAPADDYDPTSLVIWQGKKTLAHVTLTGF